VLSFEIKTKSGDWMDLDDAPEEGVLKARRTLEMLVVEKNRSKIEMRAMRQEPEPEEDEPNFSGPSLS